jgi:hypothetical protein
MPHQEHAASASELDRVIDARFDSVLRGAANSFRPVSLQHDRQSIDVPGQPGTTQYGCSYTSDNHPGNVFGVQPPRQICESS